MSHLCLIMTISITGDMNCTIKDTAKCFSVSERTIKRRLQEYNISIQRQYSGILDDELDGRIEFVLHHMPRAGELFLLIHINLVFKLAIPVFVWNTIPLRYHWMTRNIDVIEWLLISVKVQAF